MSCIACGVKSPDACLLLTRHRESPRIASDAPWSYTAPRAVDFADGCHRPAEKRTGDDVAVVPKTCVRRLSFFPSRLAGGRVEGNIIRMPDVRNVGSFRFQAPTDFAVKPASFLNAIDKLTLSSRRGRNAFLHKAASDVG